MKLSIILPTRDEASIIVETLSRLAGSLGESLCRDSEVIIADDGSDELPELIRSTSLPFTNIQVLRNSPPLGKGWALAQAFQVARGEFSGFLDADLSTSPAYITHALPPLEKENCELVIGSRWVPGATVERSQHPLKTILGDILRVGLGRLLFLGGRRFQDTQCGFKFFRTSVAKELYQGLQISDGMADIEILLRANERGYRVLELPIQWKDERESKRPLRRTLWPDIKAISILLFRYRIFPAFTASRRSRSTAQISLPPQDAPQSAQEIP